MGGQALITAAVITIITITVTTAAVITARTTVILIHGVPTGVLGIIAV